MKSLSPAKQWAIIIAVVAFFLVFGHYAEDIGRWVGQRDLPPPKPQPPLSITWRESSLDSKGLVMQVHNTSGEHLSCAMVVTNFIAGEGTTYHFAVSPSSMEEIGIVECNWSFKSGETVAIGTEGYANILFKVP